MTLEDLIKAFDYKVSYSSLEELESLKILRETLNKSINITAKIPRTTSLENAIQESKSFITDRFKLHKIDHINNMLGVKTIDPYELPFEKNESKVSTAKALYYSIKGEYPHTLYQKIEIYKHITEFTSSTITHEITHTQQGAKKGNIIYFTNTEVLPILLELIFNLEKYPLRKDNLIANERRILSIPHDIYLLESLLEQTKIRDLFLPNTSNKDLDERIIATSTYIESTLRALYLSYLYDMSNVNIKKEILARIQEVFDAKRSVEDFLNYYEATFESSLDYLQKRFKTKEK